MSFPCSWSRRFGLDWQHRELQMVPKTILRITVVPQGLPIYRIGLVMAGTRIDHLWAQQKSFPWLDVV